VTSPASSRWTLVRHALLYGAVGGALIVVLQLARYRYLIFSHAFEVYAAIIAVVFVGVGLWFGATLTGRPERIVVQQVEVEVPVAVPVASPAPAEAGPFAPDPARREALGITKRELEILELIAAGLSNKEIADRIFVSENTVKTHSSRLFEKLGARRRTQAVKAGQGAGLIP
jgi:two-component system, NarL family, response regulator LiaR